MNLQEDLMISKDLSLVSQQFNFNVNDVPPVGTDKFIMKKIYLLKKITNFYTSLSSEIFKDILDNAQKYLAWIDIGQLG